MSLGETVKSQGVKVISLDEEPLDRLPVLVTGLIR